METSGEAVPIGKEDLGQHLDSASAYIKNVKWRPKKTPTSTQQKPGTQQWRSSSSHPMGEPEKVSLFEIVSKLCGDPLLLSENGNHVLMVVRRGIQIGAHVSALYAKASGLDRLIDANRRGRLTDGQSTEFREKNQTASAVALFSLAYYTAWEMSQQELDGTTKPIDFPGIPELALRSPVEAVSCALYYFGAGISQSGMVRTEGELVRFAEAYWNATLEEIRLREDSLSHVEAFTQRSYKLADSEFVINGWSTELNGAHSSIEFNRTAIEEIVGNRDAKHYARRLAQRLICYNPDDKRNPVFDVGGLSPVNLGYGIPGTGKSMIIAATATLIADYCDWLGVPFLFWPMPDTVISTFQGGSGERMMKWMAPLRNPSQIIYAPIDDAENNLEERTRQGVSAGVREVIGVFLRNTEGAYAVHRGNTAIELYTNIPEQIDRAVMSRIRRRTAIDGATEHVDFLDQDHLWWRKWGEIDPEFVNLIDPDDYQYLSAQVFLVSLAQAGERITEPKEPRVRDIFRRVLEERDPKEQRFFADFYLAFKEQYPFFSSRDVRNIQSAVDGRIMDFDFPEEWMEDPEVFFRSDYDGKMAMLRELMRGNMGGLSFADLRLEEAIRYMDNMARIADTSRDRAIEAEVERLSVHKAALTQLEERG